MYFSSPNQPIEWESTTPWQGFYITISEDLISNNQHLAYSFLNYGLHEPLYLKEEEAFIWYFLRRMVYPFIKRRIR